MPTQSDSNYLGEWAARTDLPKRSIFGNYRAEAAPLPGSARANQNRPPEKPAIATSLQAGIDLAVARSFIHRYLAKAYEDPSPDNWAWLCAPATQASLRGAWNVVALDSSTAPLFRPGAFSDFHAAYLAAFGHAARGSCPLNEIEYGDIKADPLCQPHRLADLAAFYRAFGLEVAEEAGERHDHLCLELEFACVLAAKEAYALENCLDPEQIEACRDAQKQFLREHLGRWTPAFTRRLAATTGEPGLRALADFTRAFVESECARFGVKPGSQELALRPADEAAEHTCESCGINTLPPGAVAAT